MTPYKIILADDHAMFRHGIRNLIEKIAGFEISGEADDGLELLELLKSSVPDLIILDIAMPRLRGLEALREVKKHFPKVKILILTMHDNEEFVKQAVTGKADGFILKEEPSSELIQAIKDIRNGKKYFSPRLSGALLSFLGAGEPAEALSNREKEVLQYLAKGMGTQEISEALYISIHTIRRHRYNILQKLKLKSTADLIKYAITKGYV
jgi:DNA-binding NarL/FixJ family response regulator